MAQAQFAAFGDAFDPADFGLEIEAPISVDEQSTVDNVRIGAAAKRIGPLFEGAGVEFTTEPFLEAAHPKENPDYTKWHIVADSSTYSPRHIEGTCVSDRDQTQYWTELMAYRGFPIGVQISRMEGKWTRMETAVVQTRKPYLPPTAHK